MRAFSCCGERGLLFVEVRGLLIAVASLVVEHFLTFMVGLGTVMAPLGVSFSTLYYNECILRLKV